MKVFFDTSALIKRYIDEDGSDAVFGICQQADKLAISIICPTEMISTLNRLVRENTLTQEDYQQVKGILFSEMEDVEIVPILPEVVRNSIHALEKNTLRAMDAIHIGCASTIKPDLFVSADKRQLAAAEQSGLAICRV